MAASGRISDPASARFVDGEQKLSHFGELTGQPPDTQAHAFGTRKRVQANDVGAVDGAWTCRNRRPASSPKWLNACLPATARFALFDATRLRDQQFVALVSGTHGSKDKETRERVFSGFNTPLLPEVLICTSVGQEGIDIHRHCGHVVHFDLASNPAVMEQGTGRTDRIGSKTFRERALDTSATSSFLEIGVPYLAGTYDERMYEELRLRAQTFEVLTGGDLTVDAMRVKLHVWADDNCQFTTSHAASQGDARQAIKSGSAMASRLKPAHPPKTNA